MSTIDDVANLRVEPMGDRDVRLYCDILWDYGDPPCVEQPVSVPEPGTALLILVGLAGIGLVRRREGSQT